MIAKMVSAARFLHEAGFFDSMKKAKRGVAEGSCRIDNERVCPNDVVLVGDGLLALAKFVDDGVYTARGHTLVVCDTVCPISSDGAVPVS